MLDLVILHHSICNITLLCTPFHTTSHHTTPNHAMLCKPHQLLHTTRHSIPLYTMAHHQYNAIIATQSYSNPHYTTLQCTTRVTPQHRYHIQLYNNSLHTIQHTTPHHINLHLTTPHHIKPHHTTSHHTTPHYTTSYHITSH